MKWSLPLLLVIGLAACSTGGRQSTECKETPCESPCIKIYQPVCGCNGKTYGNSCEAECHGITTYTEGPCKTEE